MNISILITSRDNEKLLLRTLESLSTCEPPAKVKWEIIVVNHRGRQPFDRPILAMQEHLPIKFFAEDKEGVSNARNRTIQESNGELLIFTDDDIRFPQDWLQIYWKAYQNMSDDFFWGGPVASDFEGTPPEPELLAASHASVKGMDYGPEARVLNKTEFLLGANWACSRNNILQAQGFNSALGLNARRDQPMVGEETDLMRRLRNNGVRDYYLPDARVSHFVPEWKCTLEHIGERWEASGIADTISLKGEENPPLLFGKPRWAFRSLTETYLAGLFKKLRGKKAYKEYTQYRYFLGVLKGY